MEEEGEPDEFIDVLDILDGRGEPESDDDTTQTQTRPEKTLPTADEESNSRSESHSDSDEEEDGEEEDEHEPSTFEPSLSEDEDEDETGSALQNLEAFITTLSTEANPGTKRKASPLPTDEPARKRRVLKDSTQVGLESEWGVHPGENRPPSSSSFPFSHHTNQLTNARISQGRRNSTSQTSSPLCNPPPRRSINPSKLSPPRALWWRRRWRSARRSAWIGRRRMSRRRRRSGSGRGS